MNSFLELCRRRRSVRAYDPLRAVDRAALERCLEAARLAPSACNSQPWTFLVVENPEQRSAAVGAALSGAYGMNKFIRDAPVLVVVRTERSRFAARVGGLFRGVQYSLLDIGIAAEHFCLQAEEEGLGTCWLGWFNEPALKKALGLRRTDHVDVVLSVGHPTDQPREKKRKSMDEIRTYV